MPPTPVIKGTPNSLLPDKPLRELSHWGKRVLHSGVNLTALLHDGRFLKYGLEHDNTPLLAQPVSHALKALGVPHILHHSGMHYGQAFTVAEDIGPHENLNHLRHDALKEAMHRGHVPETVAAEWLLNIGDRHLGNYIVRDNQPITSIDHSSALAHEQPGDEFASDDGGWHAPIWRNGLYVVAGKFGMHAKALRPEFLHAAHSPEFLHHVESALHLFPEPYQSEARELFHHRLSLLQPRTELQDIPV